MHHLARTRTGKYLSAGSIRKKGGESRGNLKRVAKSSYAHVTVRLIGQLLTELDVLEALTNVIAVAATNRPDIINAVWLRPGRFDMLCPLT